jgi:NADPH:quinone reductase
MNAIEITSYGAPEVLRLTERPAPVAGAGEVLIRVAAAGVNRPDVLQRKGLYPVPPGASDLPGLEVAGVIVDGDRNAMAAAAFAVGDRICALVAGGGYAELCVAPVGQCLPVPATLSDVEAASLPETFFTVWSNVFDRARLSQGETLLIQGGTSGIGVTAIQLAKAAGTSVIATAGSDDKCAACVRLGADHAINYRSHDFVGEVKRLTDGRGVDVILDMVAGPYVAREVQCLADDGRLAIIAVQGGVESQFDAGVVLRRRLTITGSTLRPRPVSFKAAIAASLRRQVWPWLDRQAGAGVVTSESGG